MKHTGPPPALATWRQDWIAAALGTTTVATLIAGATVGAYVTLMTGRGDFASIGNRGYWSEAIFAAVMLTLGVYLFVVAAGMGTVFTTDQQERHKRVRSAAVLFYVQVLSVIIFAILISAAAFTDTADKPEPGGETNQMWCPVDFRGPEPMTKSTQGKPFRAGLVKCHPQPC